MASRIFFYGLYMDASLLEEIGLQPSMVGLAKLDDFELRIGDRATLVPAPGRSTYGVLLDLSPEDAEALYSRPEVSDYQPEVVDAILLSDTSKYSAVCYVLPEDDLSTEANVDYARKLAALVVKLGVPSEYAQEILRYANDT